MKKHTPILMAVFVGLGGIASAQRINSMVQLSAASRCVIREMPGTVTPEKADNAHRVASSAFYTQDFAGGIPAGWTNNGAPASALWEGRTGLAGDTIGSRGAFSGKAHLKSPTAANGFIIFDSDYLDNGGSTTGVGTSPAPHKGVLTSANIDCSTHSSVILHFNQYFLRFAARTYVKVSNGVKDSLYEINKTTPAPNAGTSLSSKIGLNITDIAANQPNVTLSFIFDGTVTYPGTSGKGYYNWQIDDVYLKEGDEPDLVMEDDGMLNYYTEGLTVRVPAKQYTPGFKFDAEIYNLSAAPINNVSVIATFKDVGGNVIATSTSPARTLAAFKRDTITWNDSTLTLPHGVPGAYTGVLSVQSSLTDPDLSNNSFRTYPIAVTDSTFARDNSFLSQITGTADFAGGTAAGFGIANQYTLKGPQQVSSISVYLGTATTPGSNFEVRVLDTAMQVITASKIYEVQGSDPGTLVKVVFDHQDVLTNLPAGTYYAAVYCYEQDQSTTPPQQITFGDDTTIPQTPNVSKLNVGTTWYSGNGNAYLLRMTMVGIPDGIASIASENGLSLSQNIPNPFNGVSSINYTIASAGKVSLEVTDIAGRKVAEINEGVKNAGSYQVSLNAADFNKGIYFYTLKAGAVSLTKKMIVIE